MQIHSPSHHLIERRNESRRQHFDRREKARFEPFHPDRRTTAQRREQRDKHDE